MELTPAEVARSFGCEAGKELNNALAKIKHCLDQLSDEQVWWRPIDSMNSVANLSLHLCGNLGQWILAGVGGDDDTRNRPGEFAAREGSSKSELLQKLEATVSQAVSIVEQVTPDELLRVRTIQGFEVSGTQAIVDSVAHFRGHAQEIVHLTRCQLGDRYQFDFVPQTAEEARDRGRHDRRLPSKQALGS